MNQPAPFARTPRSAAFSLAVLVTVLMLGGVHSLSSAEAQAAWARAHGAAVQAV